MPVKAWSNTDNEIHNCINHKGDTVICIRKFYQNKEIIMIKNISVILNVIDVHVQNK